MSLYKPQEPIYFQGPNYYIPTRCITNKDLIDWMGVKLKDSLIEKRTGIKTRYWVDGQSCSDLGYNAAKNLIKDLEIDTQNIGTLILSTISGDFSSPPTSPLIQDRLKLQNIGSFDFSAACAGFTAGLILGQSLCSSGSKDILLISSEIRSKFLSKKDFQTNALFGDGSSSILITRERKNAHYKFLGGKLFTDGSVADIISIPFGGSKNPHSIDPEDHTLRMKGGAELFLKALNGMYESSLSLLEDLKISLDEIDWIVPHQANLHMIEALTKKLQFPEEKVIKTIQKWGNTSGASVGMALSTLKSENIPKAGQKVLLVSAGGGGIAANAVLEVQ